VITSPLSLRRPHLRNVMSKRGLLADSKATLDKVAKDWYFFGTIVAVKTR
jgi:hypothetical protein